jgi:hypothetical protein
MDQAKAARRPLVSPQYPNNSAPSGLARKPTANTPKVAINDNDGSEEGKKRRDRMDAKYPNRAKSYHSSTFPIAPAKTVFRNTFGWSKPMETSLMQQCPCRSHHTMNECRAPEPLMNVD